MLHPSAGSLEQPSPQGRKDYRRRSAPSMGGGNSATFQKQAEGELLVMRRRHGRKCETGSHHSKAK